MSDRVETLPATAGIRKPFLVERALATTFRAFFAHLVPFLAIAAVLEAPALALNAYATLSVEPGALPTRLWLLPVSTLVGLITHYLVMGALTFGVFRHLRGQPIGWGDCLAGAVARFPTMFLASILVGLAMMVGYVLCIVPGIYVYVVYSTALPAVVVEERAALAAMARSKQLTLGHRWPVFGTILLGFVISAVPIFAATALAAGGARGLWLIFTSAWSVVSVTFQSVLSCVVYYQLRETREDLDAPELAAAFD